LWAYCTTTKTNTNLTLFQLVCGQEVVIPIELELASLRLDLQKIELNSTNVSQRVHALLYLKEQRNFSLNNLNRRKKYVKKYFDKRVKTIILKVG